jgi:GNAT superfamily N-acetyltransferase
MFQDMGDVSGGRLRAKARTRLERWIDNGNYIGWLATPADEQEMIVAGAGVQLQPILPRPLDVSTIGEGRQGTIVNVFTEPPWRQRGIAALLIKEIIIWSKYEQIDRLVLHASDEGRSIYERLGFVASNEMVCDRESFESVITHELVRTVSRKLAFSAVAQVAWVGFCCADRLTSLPTALYKAGSPRRVGGSSARVPQG